MQLLELPEEILSVIFEQLEDDDDCMNARLVCKKWARICLLPHCHAHDYHVHPKRRDAGKDVFVHQSIVTDGCTFCLYAQAGDHVYLHNEKTLVRARPEQIRVDLPLLFISPCGGGFNFTQCAKKKSSQ